MNAPERAIEQLNQLISEYRELAPKSRHDDLSDLDEGRIFANRLQAALERLAPPGTSYASRAARFGANPVAFTRDLVYVAIALRDDLKDGWLESVIELVHADTHSDFLEMADELAGKGYKDAAAVVAGSSLEVHLKALCGKHGVETESNGKPKKADTLNADLVKAGAYGKLEQKQVTAWLGMRNSAAHGEYDSYSLQEVVLFIASVRGFMSKYPG
jgi:hypothetical protein